MIKHFFCLAFMTAISLSCLAQELITDRPDQTESSTTIPAKHLQWESGFSIGSLNRIWHFRNKSQLFYKLGIQLENTTMNPYSSINKLSGNWQGIPKVTINYFVTRCGEPGLRAQRNQNNPEIPIASHQDQFNLVISVHPEKSGFPGSLPYWFKFQHIFIPLFDQ